MPGTFVFCDPSGGASCQAVYYDQTVPANTVGIITGVCAQILGGIPAAAPTNNNNGDLSTILMGDINTINTFAATGGTFNTIINGQCNTIGGTPIAGTAVAAVFSSIFGGSENCINTDLVTVTQYASIFGGQGSCIAAGSDFAVIAGGCGQFGGGQNSFIGGGALNIAGDRCTAVGGGGGNRAGADYAAILGGSNNCAQGCASFIGGGATNTLVGNPSHPNCSSIVGGELNNIGFIGGIPANISDYSFVGGGFTNNIFSSTSSILGGSTNTINVFSDCSFISGGQGHNVGAAGGAGLGVTFSGIGGGQSNTIDDTAFASTFSGIFGGCNHTINGNNLFVGGGDTNIINSAFGPVLCSAIVGGSNNIINDDGIGVTSDVSFIGGGELHQMGGQCSFIGGGSGNIIFSAGGLGPVNLSTIAGGTANLISDDGVKVAAEAFIGGGTGNHVHGRASSVVGGDGNYVWGQHAVIAGGQSNYLDTGTHHSFIGGGTLNGLFGGSACSFVGGGEQNRIGAFAGGGIGTIWSSIGGGCNNCIDDTLFASSFSGIFSGANHFVNGNNLFVGGGDINFICSTNGIGPVACSSIAGGWDNMITDSGVGGVTANMSFIGGGCKNHVFSIGSSIAGGMLNCIDINSPLGPGGPAIGVSFIGGGRNNNISAQSSFIGSGLNNTVACTPGSFFMVSSAIAGGRNNLVNGQGVNSFIGAGNQNCISGSDSAIGGGITNNIESQASFVGGGQANFINSGSSNSFIGGGFTNGIGISVGGNSALYSSIGGGQNNCIDDTAAAVNHSGIFSGFGNTVSGSCSVVLGGLNNGDGGFPNTAVFGNTLVASVDPATMGVPSAFWVDELIVPNIPVDVTGFGIFPFLPAGALYTNVPLGSGYMASQVFVK